MGAQPSKSELLYKEVQNGNIEAVKTLRRSGADLEWMDKEGRTPLILACTRGDLLEMALTLINLGANMNSYRPGSHGGTPLHHAAKRGHERAVNLLLQHGANPLAINDDCETPLQMARARGHLTVVRIIEGRISLFSGMIRELSGPGFLETIARQWVSKKVWVVVLPSASPNPRRPPRFELVIYPTSKVAQPRTTILLSKVEIEKPEFSLPDPVLVLSDKGAKARYRFLSEIEGDKKQLQQLYGACVGIPQGVVNNPVAGESSVQQSLPPTESATAPLTEESQLAMAIEASLQQLSQVRLPLPSGSQPSLTNDLNGQGSTSDTSYNGWGPSVRTEMPVNNNKFGQLVDEVNITSHNGWGPVEARPNSSNLAESSMTKPTPTISGLPVSEDTSTAHPCFPSPSAPPLPVENISQDGPVLYPSIDTSPIEFNLPDKAEHRPQYSRSSSKSQSNSSGSCVICWDAPAEGVCIPCGHLAGCMACLNEIKGKNWGCPICRTTIEQVIKVYAVGLENPKQ